MTKVLLSIFSLGICLNVLAQETLPVPILFNHGRNATYQGARGLAFGPEGKSMYYVSASDQKDNDNQYRLKIHRIIWTKKGWSDPEIVVDQGFTYNSPAVSPDGTRLYFASTAPLPGESEEGDYNIWFAELTEQGPKTAQPLNATNSDGTEMPYSMSGSTLYFGSNRDGGLGGLDIYSLDLITSAIEHWAELSSPYSDLLTIDPDGAFALTIQFKMNAAGRFERGVLSYFSKEGQFWQPPVVLDFLGNEGYHAYPISALCVSSDRSSLYFVNSFLVWSLPIKELLSSNRLPAPNVPQQKILYAAPLKSNEREIFGESILMRSSNGLCISGDGSKLYTARLADQYNPSEVDRLMRIYVSEKQGSKWSMPKPVSFGEGTEQNEILHEYHPMLSPDESSIYYNAQKFIAENRTISTPYENHLWHVSTLPDGLYEKPTMLAEVNQKEHEDSYANPTISGRIYFKSNRVGGLGQNDFWVYDPTDASIVPLSGLNTEFNENDLFVDPQERFILFNRYYHTGHKEGDVELMISFREGDKWTTPRILEGVERNTDWELTPFVDRKLEYLYYEFGNVIARFQFMPLLTHEERRLLDKL